MKTYKRLFSLLAFLVSLLGYVISDAQGAEDIYPNEKDLLAAYCLQSTQENMDRLKWALGMHQNPLTDMKNNSKRALEAMIKMAREPNNQNSPEYKLNLEAVKIMEAELKKTNGAIPQDISQEAELLSKTFRKKEEEVLSAHYNEYRGRASDLQQYLDKRKALFPNINGRQNLAAATAQASQDVKNDSIKSMSKDDPFKKCFFSCFALPSDTEKNACLKNNCSHITDKTKENLARCDSINSILNIPTKSAAPVQPPSSSELPSTP
jgi:hypothetical protein